ncbi:MMPL family transporter [Prauserella cavernicola]|uniref:MMPL family transporter n=1 Tax=Prauserella cavernicola TaxID=2800127 RepID=A0A934V643_9PSEU|nr:MMPL family transporter [Prauserella cavernicola]MBK1785293.1 MMPL family transporter [Prauserella cavernicola]
MNTPTLSGSRLTRLAAWAQRRHWLALGLWIAVLAAITVTSQALGADYRDDHSLPGTESQQVIETFEREAPAEQGETVQLVLAHDDGVAQQRDRVEALLREVAALPHIAGVQSPFATPGAVSADGTIAYATVALDADTPAEDVRALVGAGESAAGDGLDVAFGGDPVREAEEGGGGAAEGAGILAALVILVLMFGSLLAAAVPVLTAVLAVGSTIGVIGLVSWLVDMPSYAPPLMMLVGIGVGIDYALLIFSRFRGELLAGRDRQQAARVALDTAGRSVLFAGCTVIIALLGLLALGLGSLRGVAFAVALTVLVTMIASITLLPALLSVFGRRIERRIVARASRREQGRRWRSLASAVQRRPVVPLVVSLAALGALSLPALDLRLGFADAGNDPQGSTSRQAYDLLAEGFGAGVNGPLIVVAEGGAAAAEEAAAVLERTPGVASATPPQSLSPEVSTVVVFPDSAPQDAATHELVERLRADVLPGVAERTGATLLVGGSVAAADDFAAAVSDRLPLFILVVVGLSALLLAAVFRSVLIPLKAAVLNLLSIGASLGVITLVFGQGLFGVQPGPIEAFVPVMIFAIVFGLSMDYEVFLVARMHEEWRRTRDAGHAVREGLAATGGVITAAAAIMIVVFGAFVLSPDRMLQQFGLGLAVAVLLDAFVIRCLIVPAVMRLFGERAWWLPRRLSRALPEVKLERDEVGVSS